MQRLFFVYPLLLAICLYLTAAGVYIWMFGLQPVYSHEKWGQFGDFIGGVVNPALALVTIMLLLATLGLQRRELQLTRREMARTSRALRAQVKQFNDKTNKDDLFGRANHALVEIERILNSTITVHRTMAIPPKRDEGPSSVDVTLLAILRQWKPGGLGAFAFVDVVSRASSLLAILYELAHYLELIDASGRERNVLTDYYRRRAQ